MKTYEKNNDDYHSDEATVVAVLPREVEDSEVMDRDQEAENKKTASSENCNGCCDCYCYPLPMTTTHADPAGHVNPESSGCCLTLYHEISSCLYQMICCPLQAGEDHAPQSDRGCCCLFQTPKSDLSASLIGSADNVIGGAGDVVQQASCCDGFGCDACADDVSCCCPFGGDC